MRTQSRLSVTPGKNRIAIKQQVVRGNRRADAAAFFENVADRVLCCDVLEHNFQVRVLATKWNQHFVDENLLPVEYIYLRSSDLSVYQQRHGNALHFLERKGTTTQIGNAGL